MKQKIILIVLILSLLILGFFLTKPAPSLEGKGEGRTPLFEATKVSTKKNVDLYPQRFTKIQGKNGFLISIFNSQGQPLRSKITWIQGKMPPLGPELLLNQTFQKRNPKLPPLKNGFFQKKPLKLILSEPQWIWLKAEGKDGEGNSFVLYRMLPPSEGVKNISFVHNPKVRRIHVFLMDVEGKGNEKFGKVNLYAGPINGPGALVRRGSKAANAFGYVFFDVSNNKGFLICGPKASLEDKQPYTARLLFPKGVFPNDSLVALVPKGPRTRVVFELTIDDGLKRLSRPPKVFLRTLNLSGGIRFSSKGFLVEGKNRLNFSGPPGNYEAFVLPHGINRLSSKFRNFHVVQGEHLVLKGHLFPNKKKTKVVFSGPLGQEGPFYVYPRFEQNTNGIEEEPGYSFLGKFRWHLPKGLVLLPREPFRFIVLSAGTCRLSKKIYKPPFPETLKVPLIEGSLVELEVDPSNPKLLKVHGPLVVCVQDSFGFRRYLLKRKIHRIGGSTVLRWKASIVVPRGEKVVFQLKKMGKPTALLEKKIVGSRDLVSLSF